MSDLSEFLLARIADDERRARDKWQRPHWANCNTQGDHSSLGDECDCGLPARVLAECEAKRRIVQEHPHEFEEGDGRLIGDRWSCQTCHNGYTDWWCLTLRLLALPYADHPDYDEAWRP